MSRIDEFFAYVQRQTGLPPAPFPSWSAAYDAFTTIPAAELPAIFDEVESTFVVDTSTVDYSRWSNEKRLLANSDAALALREVGRNGATPEQIRRMQGYTGFGGLTVGVLPDSFPEAYVRASREWDLARRTGAVTSEETEAIMGRVLDQYFTGLDVCAAMHSLVQRTNPEAKAYLEPSAGIGRMIRAGKAGLDWTAIELDELMASMMAAMYPDAQVFAKPFEAFASYARKNEITFDAVIGNPPYGERPIQFAQRDLGSIKEASDYFTLAGAALLKPGGTLVYVVPLSTLTRSTSVEVRQKIVAGCHFRGAAILPSGAFPNVREGTFAITVFTRRTEPAQLTDRERAYVAGGYLSLPEAQTAICGGEWKQGTRGEYLYGRPDLTKIGSLWLAPGPTAGSVSVATAKPSAGRQQEAQSEVQTGPEVPSRAEVRDATNAALGGLAASITAWIRLINRDPQAAESQREAIRTAVVEAVAEHGNPHPSGPAALRAVVTRQGELDAVLTEPVSKAQFANEPEEDATLTELVDWYSERQGFAEVKDLRGVSFEAACANPDVFVDMRADGPVFMARWAYFQGPPAPLLASVEGALQNTALDPRVRNKLDTQKSIILQHWSGSKTIPEIGVTPRSPFVPVEALIAWIGTKIQVGKLPLRVEETKLVLPDDEETIEKLRKMAISNLNLDPLYWLLAYYNRDTMVENLSRDGSQKNVYAGLDAAGVVAKDKKYTDEFVDWLSDGPWAQVVETEYNAKFAPALVSPIPTDPVPLAGLGSIVPHPHQYQFVRRVSMGGKPRPFLYALDVGGGKCRRGESLTLTNRGLVPIRSLFDSAHMEAGAHQTYSPNANEITVEAPGDLRVLAHVGPERKATWVPVRGLYRQQIADTESTIIVRTERGSHDEVTAVHPFPVIRGGDLVWVQAKDLIEGDDLVVPRRLPEPDGAAEVPVPPDDLVEIMGWLIGDGSEQGENTFILTQKDTAVLEHVRGLLLARYGEGITPGGLPWARIIEPTDDKHVAFLRIHIPAFTDDMIKWDFPQGTNSGGRRMPRWALQTTNRVLRIFLRAYFDADGYAPEDRRRVEITSASRQLSTETRYALNRFGIRAARVEKTKWATNSRTPTKRPYQYITMYGDDVLRFGELIGFSIARKQAVLDAHRAFNAVSNLNVGIPIGDIVEDIAECGISVRMLTGFLRVGEFRSINRDTLDKMIGALRWRLSDEGAVDMAKSSMGRKKLGEIEANRPMLERSLARLERLQVLDEHVRFERVERVETGRAGGFVYDVEVDVDPNEYDDQNYVAGEGALIMHNTISGIAAAMRWRQTGAAHRILIDVPTSVLAKWYDDARKLFPSARIGLMGLSRTDRGATVNDTPDMRLEKWLRFAAGGYDFLICGHESFLNDVEPTEAEVCDVISQVVWARRGEAEKIARIRRKREQIKVLENSLTQYMAADNPRAWALLFRRSQGDWAKARAKKIASTQTELDEARASLELMTEGDDALGTDNEVARVQKMIRRFVAKKLYRPSAGSEGAFDEGDDDVLSLADDEDPGESDPEDAEDEAIASAAKKQHNPKPGLVTFESLGIDALIVDEAHRFKNLWFPANRIEYVGNGQDEIFGVKKAWDMFLKTRLIHRSAGGVGGVVFLTATPVTNSPLELYNELDMVNPRVFENAGIHDKEQFIDRYWTIEAKEVPRPNGTFEPAPALVGFKHLDEMMGLTSGTFERLSTADLVRLGWVKNIPVADPDKLLFKRDAAQTALIKSLAAIYSVWAKDEEKESESVACGVSTLIDPTIWHVAPQSGRLVSAGTITIDDAPEILQPGTKDEPNKYQKIAQSILRLVWMSMLDKIAISPTLLEGYRQKKLVGIEDLRARAQAYMEYDRTKEAFYAKHQHRTQAEIKELWKAAKIPKPKGRRPRMTEYITSEIALAIFQQIGLAQVVEFYASRPIPEKIQALGEFVRDHRTRNGRSCGHVVFLDAKALHGITKETIAKVAGIPPRRIVILPRDKGARLAASKGFNGTPATSLEPEIPPIYDVVIGTGALMAEGIDLQTRSCAVHHLDLPWEPAALHQRNGRSVRQGNTMGHVDLRYYLTEKSFDALRFDKVAKKAQWWEALFSGAAATSNPAATSDSTQDLDQLLLELVIEDPDVLKTCLDQMREARELRLLVKRREDASRDWIQLNAAYAKARSATDATRRDLFFNLAMRKRTAWEIAHRDFVVPGALARVVDEVVVCDWELLQYRSVGQTLGRAGTQARARITDLRVRSSGFIATTREFGELDTRVNMGSDLFRWDVAERGWSYSEEREDLIQDLAAISRMSWWFKNAKLPSDLWDHATDLWAASAAAIVQGRNAYMNLPYTSPIVIMRDGRVSTGIVAGLHGSQSGASFETFLRELLAVGVERVFPVEHPEARGHWLSALKEDRLVCPKPGYSSSMLAGITTARANSGEWRRTARQLFGSDAGVTEALRVRLPKTGEVKTGAGDVGAGPVFDSAGA